MYENIVLPVQNLRKTLNIRPGGLCRILFFKKDDVLAWPEKHPGDGVIYDPIQLKAGAVFYTFQPADKERFFTEDSKSDTGGPFVEVTVNGRLGGNTLNYITSLDSMMHFEFGIIVIERTGEKRLVGNNDRGADVGFGYTSGDADSSRINNIKFTWKHSQRMPIYESDVILIDDQIIPIVPGVAPESGSALNEIISFSAVPSYTLMWTTARKEKFGNAAVLNVFILGEDAILRKTEVEVKSNSILNPSQYDIDFGGVSTGIIVIS
jgi:hypothetical protein